MCVPLVLAKNKKEQGSKMAREFYFEKSRKDQTEGREKGTRNRVFFFFFFFTILPANVIISVHVREEILGHRLEGKYMF